MHARVIAAGGGGADASRPLDERFAALTGPGGHMLYWPIALPEDHPLRDSCYTWITSVFGPVGIGRIEMWTEFHGHAEADLDRFDSIYIGGGNTYRLLHLLRASGFDRALLHRIGDGLPVYGGSAGAAIIGCDIRTVAHMDHNTVGLVDVRGLDVIRGYAIWCHYEPQDAARIAAYIADYAHPVLALSERAGVILEDGRLMASGYEPTMHFTREGSAVVQLGRDVPRSQPRLS